MKEGSEKAKAFMAEFKSLCEKHGVVLAAFGPPGNLQAHIYDRTEENINFFEFKLFADHTAECQSESATAGAEQVAEQKISADIAYAMLAILEDMWGCGDFYSSAIEIDGMCGDGEEIGERVRSVLFKLNRLPDSGRSAWHDRNPGE